MQRKPNVSARDCELSGGVTRRTRKLSWLFVCRNFPVNSRGEKQMTSVFLIKISVSQVFSNKNSPQICFQPVAEETKQIRFCGSNVNDLERWLALFSARTSYKVQQSWKGNRKLSQGKKVARLCNVYTDFVQLQLRSSCGVCKFIFSSLFSRKWRELAKFNIQICFKKIKKKLRHKNKHAFSKTDLKMKAIFFIKMSRKLDFIFKFDSPTTH